MLRRRTNSFRPADGVPERGLGPVTPGLQRLDAGIKVFRVEERLRQHRVACAFQDLDHVEGQRRESGMPLATAEENPGVPLRDGACLVEQRHEPAANELVVAQTVVGAHIRFPYLANARWLGPQTQNVMIVVLQDHPAARLDGAHHVRYHGQRTGDVFEHKTGVRDVERSPFIITQRQRHGIAATEVDESFLAFVPCQSEGFGELLLVALDGQRTCTPAGGARQEPRELAESAAHVEHVLAVAQSQFLQAGFIDQVVQLGEPPLFLCGSSMNVAGGILVLAHNIHYGFSARHEQTLPGRDFPLQQKDSS